MSLTRREMLLASLSALIAGCASTGSTTAGRRPGPSWPRDIAAPSDERLIAYRPPTQAAPAAPTPTAGGIDAIARSRWARTGPVMSRINPMSGIQRITMHHEGSTTFWASDYNTTATRIESIRGYHVGERRFGDIGYHYVIDRAGRVWEGRDLRYQGAHVSQQNEHNLGVMCLGNFNKQSPTDAQLATLRKTVAALAAKYHVPRSRIYTHRELGPTSCPGSVMQPRIAAMRSSGQFA